MLESEKPCVFFDTNYLLGTKLSSDERGGDVVEWNKLLQYVRDGRVLLYTSEIVVDEYVSHKRDILLTRVLEARRYSNDFFREAKSNLVSKDENIAIEVDVLPSDAQIFQLSEAAKEKFIKDYMVNVVPHKAEHASATFAKYHAWQSPFDMSGSKENEKTRRERKEHLPDGFIIEAVLGLVAEYGTVYCLTRDNRVKDALGHHGVECYDKAEDVLKIISGEVIVLANESLAPLTGQLDSDTKASTDDQTSSTNLVDFFQDQLSKENKMLIDVLGYIASFEPADKEKIYQLLAAKNYSIELLNNVVHRLVLWGIVKDTGSRLITLDKKLSGEARQKVESEILEFLQRS